ncbi:MAG: putative N-acetylmannosamine-6-phosphate 2-epimerase [Cryobacterium sp.]|nr:putative N-acetylmannosamine-6-phosphate 2-epimerase [Micrococcales bacterium]MBX3077916.1 putative N-acetylmannosamine-6-phosphate 2-epimerase [Cryobacterium sp.]MBX3310938.1 putative N-acetylmannosamine-6-phosphate 2-epimerase [Cryobacterium sp.]MCB1280627.1 putative N-acetylmannosamine-6-phosphate 2-epimerase [Salinibacterium sp.]
MIDGISSSVIDLLEGGLVVSVQARAGSPLRSTPIIVAMSEAILESQPAGLRLNGPEDIRAVRLLTDLPIIGLHKVTSDRRNVITPSLALAAGLAEAGADIIALDATTEVLGENFSLIATVARETGLPVMADVSTLEEGRRAWETGAALVGTTLSGYTPESGSFDGGPDLDLVSRLADAGVRVVAEGRYRTLSEVSSAFDLGAFSVVVGGAISDPSAIAARFIGASPRGLTPKS